MSIKITIEKTTSESYLDRKNFLVKEEAAQNGYSPDKHYESQEVPATREVRRDIFIQIVEEDDFDLAAVIVAINNLNPQEKE